MFLKDPTDPKWRNDAGVKLYRQILKRYAPGANANDPYHVYGMAAAYTFVEALKKAGKTPTREALVKAVSSLNVTKNPFMIPGILIKTGRNDRFPIEMSALKVVEGDVLEITLIAIDHRGERLGRSGTSEPLLFRITDPTTARSAITEVDPETAERLKEMIRRQLGIGDRP